MVTAHDVAALLIEEQKAAGNNIDKMQLQKLLYLVQGAHLALWGHQAFREPILAYRSGPVVAVVEETYRPATEGIEPLDHALGGDPDRLPIDVAETARLVLSYFGTWSGIALERFTKQPGAPWRQARGDLPLSASSREEIEIQAIAAWFRRHGINPQRARLSKKDRELLDRAAAGDEEALSALLK